MHLLGSQVKRDHKERDRWGSGTSEAKLCQLWPELPSDHWSFLSPSQPTLPQSPTSQGWPACRRLKVFRSPLFSSYLPGPDSGGAISQEPSRHTCPSATSNVTVASRCCPRQTPWSPIEPSTPLGHLIVAPLPGPLVTLLNPSSPRSSLLLNPLSPSPPNHFLSSPGLQRTQSPNLSLPPHTPSFHSEVWADNGHPRPSLFSPVQRAATLPTSAETHLYPHRSHLTGSEPILRLRPHPRLLPAPKAPPSSQAPPPFLRLRPHPRLQP
jgi:hypothetical protein